MSDHDEGDEISELVRSQIEAGIARDLAIKLLARLVSQAIGPDYVEIVQGHIRAIEAPDPLDDREVNTTIATHFRMLMLEDQDD